MKKYFILLCCFIFSDLYSQKYSVNSLDESLLTHSNAVKRSEELKVRINSTKSASVSHKWAVTIINESGERLGRFISFYDKFNGEPDISGTLYDANGKEIKSLKKKDIIDHAEIDNISMVSDTRVKAHNFYYNQYPYTVEYEEDYDLKGTFFLPGWSPMPSENCSVQQSKFIVETPLEYKLRFKESNLASKVKIETAKNISYSWEVNNLKAIENEDLSPDLYQIVPSVKIASSDFEIGKYAGSMDTWLNLGKFINQLNKDRDILPPGIKQEVHKLTDGITDPLKKINILYEYLQNSTRYIAILLGMGSWQPFDATNVANNKYGDCKALSNYMVSLLKEAGIKANYVLINGGEDVRNVIEDFPSPYFNHVITCVPLQKDTLWLECTSQTVSAGYMGSFTGNRKALLVDDDGGHLVNTPAYKASDNIALRKILATIDENGNLVAEVTSKYTGLQQDFPHQILHQANKEEKEKYLNRSIGLPTYTVEKFDYSEVKSRIPAINEYIKLSASNYASVTGKRLFLEPNIINKSIHKLPEDKNRIYPIIIKDAYIDIDSVSISIPAGYSIESLPESLHLNNKFGTYDLSFNIDQSTITLVRFFKPVAGNFSPTEYAAFSEFREKIFKGDRSKMVFVKKEG